MANIREALHTAAHSTTAPQSKPSNMQNAEPLRSALVSKGRMAYRMIRNVTERDDFVNILQANLSPASPIQSEEHLFGRSQQLKKIEEALYANGRCIFIYGDRGVGKTSLAQTVAFAKQSSSRDPVILACTPDETFSRLIKSAVNQLVPPGAWLTLSGKLSLGFLEVNAAGRPNESVPKLPEVLDVNTAVLVLLTLEKEFENQLNVVVIDEFDRITSDQERERFADFIKQVGDRRVRTKFVFCGVSDSIQSLIGAHDSCYRYLDEIKLERLGWDSRFQIIEAASNALGVIVDERPRYRIAAISDGFPHYIHRVCEKLFWEMFNDPSYRQTPSSENFRQAIAASVLGIEQHLKVGYDRAVMKDSPGFRDVLWAIADHADLTRSTEDIFNSYLRLFCNEKNPRLQKALDRKTVVSRLNTLKSLACGSILTSKRRGWYEFKENIMRGYIRLLAEQEGVELEQDYPGVTSFNRRAHREGER